jgi:hypothetical protein
MDDFSGFVHLGSSYRERPVAMASISQDFADEDAPKFVAGDVVKKRGAKKDYTEMKVLSHSGGTARVEYLDGTKIVQANFSASELELVRKGD